MTQKIKPRVSEGPDGTVCVDVSMFFEIGPDGKTLAGIGDGSETGVLPVHKLPEDSLKSLSKLLKIAFRHGLKDKDDDEDTLKRAWEDITAELCHRANLPRHLARAGCGPGGIPGLGGNLLFLPLTFILSPMANYGRRSAPYVEATVKNKHLAMRNQQYELPMFGITETRISTMGKNGQTALNGTQERLFLSLFNDAFIGLGSGPKGEDVIEGDTDTLSGLTGGRVRVDKVNEALRAVSYTRFTCPNVAPAKGNYEFGGAVFPTVLLPGEHAKGKHFFRFLVNDWVCAPLLKSLFQIVDLPEYWRIPTARAGRLYCYLCVASGLKNSPRLKTVAARLNLPFPEGKTEREVQQRKNTKATIKAAMDSIEAATDSRVSRVGRAWFSGSHRNPSLRWRHTRPGQGGPAVETGARVSAATVRVDMDSSIARLAADKSAAKVSRPGRKAAAKPDAETARLLARLPATKRSTVLKAREKMAPEAFKAMVKRAVQGD